MKTEWRMEINSNTLPEGWFQQLPGQYLSLFTFQYRSLKAVVELLAWSDQLKVAFCLLQSLGNDSIAFVCSCDLSSAIWLNTWGTDVAEY